MPNKKKKSSSREAAAALDERSPSRRSGSDGSDGEGSGASGSSVDDVPEGFTSDEYSDEDSVYADLTWPGWAAFTRSLGLAFVQWTGSVGVVRVGRMMGVAVLETNALQLSFSNGLLASSLRLTYQDIIDAPTAIVVERRADSVVFVGSVSQYRRLRRRLQALLHDQLVPMCEGVPVEAEMNLRARRGDDGSGSDGESGSERSGSKRSGSKRSKHSGSRRAGSKQSESKRSRHSGSKRA